MTEYINTLEEEFKRLANPEIAAGQKAYMKNRFEFFGVKTPDRRAAYATFLKKEFLPNQKDLEKIVKTLWLMPEREFHYFAQELTLCYLKLLRESDLELFEFMILNNSWWDTVDFIAPKLVGPYFKKYPQHRDKTVEKWLASGNIWLQRSCILFQLKYKTDFDTKLLEHVIHSLSGSKEFFINKAIGWILREYGKREPDWVVEFANRMPLHPLSRREALRIIQP